MAFTTWQNATWMNFDFQWQHVFRVQKVFENQGRLATLPNNNSTMSTIVYAAAIDNVVSWPFFIEAYAQPLTHDYHIPLYHNTARAPSTLYLKMLDLYPFDQSRFSFFVSTTTIITHTHKTRHIVINTITWYPFCVLHYIDRQCLVVSVKDSIYVICCADHYHPSM